MTPDQFAQLALALPEAHEAGHMGTRDFRVDNKIFATLGYPDHEWGVVKLTPEHQEAFVSAAPDVFRPVAGGWGRKGSTQVRLDTASEAQVGSALTAAWRKIAPKRLVLEKEPLDPRA